MAGLIPNAIPPPFLLIPFTSFKYGANRPTRPADCEG